MAFEIECPHAVKIASYRSDSKWLITLLTRKQQQQQKDDKKINRKWTDWTWNAVCNVCVYRHGWAHCWAVFGPFSKSLYAFLYFLVVRSLYSLRQCLVFFESQVSIWHWGMLEDQKIWSFLFHVSVQNCMALHMDYSQALQTFSSRLPKR